MGWRTGGRQAAGTGGSLTAEELAVDRLRIALVVDHFLPRIGGIELHVADVARRLTAAGHAVSVITTTPGSDRVGEVPVLRLEAALLPRFQVSPDPRALYRLGSLLARERFDVVHAHSSIISPLAYSTIFWCQRLGIPNVLTGHSVWGNTSNVAWLLRRMFRQTFERTQWTTVSRYTAARLERAGLPDVVVLPNGIDVSAWDSQRIASPELRVASVLRMNVKKRPQDLVRAIPEIRRRLGPDRPVRFTLVGDGPYRRHVERLVQRLGLTDCVELAGRLTRPQIQEVFRQTDLFVLPTVLEAFGIAVLEARCAGLPSVVIRSSGAAELVQDGYHGRLAANWCAWRA